MRWNVLSGRRLLDGEDRVARLRNGEFVTLTSLSQIEDYITISFPSNQQPSASIPASSAPNTKIHHLPPLPPLPPSLTTLHHHQPSKHQPQALPPPTTTHSINSLPQHPSSPLILPSPPPYNTPYTVSPARPLQNPSETFPNHPTINLPIFFCVP